MARLKELGLSTPEESQHQLDIVQVHKIVKRVGGVKSEHWFKMVENESVTRRRDPLNIQIQVARLRTGKIFSLTECQKYGTMCQH
jgi:hypothetical protein